MMQGQPELEKPTPYMSGIEYAANDACQENVFTRKAA